MWLAYFQSTTQQSATVGTVKKQVGLTIVKADANSMVIWHLHHPTLWFNPPINPPINHNGIILMVALWL